MVVDQNRAHQRVLYEGFLKQFTLETPTIQNLLFPLNLNLTSDELKIIKDIEIQLKQTGFSISEYNKDGLFLNAIPVGVKESNPIFVGWRLQGALDNDILGIENKALMNLWVFILKWVSPIFLMVIWTLGNLQILFGIRFF